MPERSRPSKRAAGKKRGSANRQNIFSKYLPLWVFGGAFVVIAIILAVVFLTPSTKTDPLDKSVGPTDAKVVATIYGDFQCPACKSFTENIEPKIKADFVDKGLIRMQFRQMAFIGDESILAAEASECANEQGRFWDYHNKIYEKQAGENVGTFTNDSLTGYAEELQLDVDKFNSCLNSHKYRGKINRETNDGQAKGVYSTPSVLINDKLAEWGGDYAKLQEIINAAITNAQ